MLHMISLGKSDTGLKRTNNEDSFLIQPELGFAALADGMGGAAAGEIASQLFTRAAQEVFTQSGDEERAQPRTLIEDVFGLANQMILDHVKEHPDHHGMGCTAELLALQDGSFHLGHVGDSRAYIFKDRRLKQLTKDHSFIQGLLDSGAITPEEARSHRMRHVILRAVGTTESLAVDLIHGELIPGDILLLCSDGLTDMVEDHSIEQILTLPVELEEKAERLIQAAKSGGGLDNITVVLTQLSQ